MKTLMRGALLALGLVVATGAFARSDVRDGNAMVTPVKGDKYSIDGVTMGKAELYGYIGDLRDREHLTGLVLKRGGDDEQRHVIGSIARTLQLKAFEQDGGDLKPIDLPAAQPTPPPPPVDSKPEATAPASDTTPPAH
ncbi:hypothetical protein [Dokdonella soli]|uniref:Uncharacterized protein n=1 Tax=Dokdonella soli TaxID=529810 RepID=A0ABN1IBB9_9GAMM